MKIFIIHARRTAFGVVRSLRDRASEIYVADTSRTPVFSSRSVTRGFIISDINQVDAYQFVEELISLAQQMNYAEEKPIVYTGKDDYLLFFARHSKVLLDYFHFSFESDVGLLEASLSKTQLIDIAKRADVLVPPSFTDQDGRDAIIENVNYPAIIKPAIKNLPEMDIVTEAFRLKVCEGPRQLAAAIDQLVALNSPFIVQELIEGGDDELYTMGVYTFKGELKAWSTSKKIRQFPPNTGECSLGKTLFEPAMKECTERLMRESGLTGVSQVEYKHHKGKYYLIEINPRVWSWHEIHNQVGVNLDLIAAEHALGNVSQDVTGPTQDQKYWQFLMMDYLYNFRLNRNIGLSDLIRDFFRCDIEAFFDWRDPKPFISHFVTTLPYIKGAVASSKLQ